MTVFRFGLLELDEERYELREAGAAVALPRLAMELLLLLVAEPGAAVDAGRDCGGDVAARGSGGRDAEHQYGGEPDPAGAAG